MIREQSTPSGPGLAPASEVDTAVIPAVPGLAEAAAAAVDRWAAGPQPARPEQTPPPPGPAEPVSEAAPAHKLAGAESGGPGACSVRCTCGEQFAGHDSVTAATQALDAHVAQAAAAEQLVDEPVTAAARDLRRGEFVATGNPLDPGLEVVHVEPSSDGEVVGVLFAGPVYHTYGAAERVELVDPEVVAEARRLAVVRARRAAMLDGLAELVRLAREDPALPLPEWSMELAGSSLPSPEAVAQFAARTGAVLERRYGRVQALWRWGSSDYGDGLTIRVSAEDPAAPADDPIPAPPPVPADVTAGSVR